MAVSACDHVIGLEVAEDGLAPDFVQERVEDLAVRADSLLRLVREAAEPVADGVLHCVGRRRTDSLTQLVLQLAEPLVQLGPWSWR